MLKKLSKIYRVLIYALPGVLFFSYYPLIHFGADQAMNFEISLPLIWLVVFDLVGLVLMLKKRSLVSGLKGKWYYLLAPGFLTLSVLWSSNRLRGLLTVGILWLICFAIYTILNLRDLVGKEEFKAKFWKVVFGTTLVFCAWSLIQCILDLVGVPREYSLMCEGCTYQSFGFPHPNGFAIEPQFLGNLLLAPTLMVMALIYKNGAKKSLLALLFIFAATLFLTFSRGAIYAFIVAMIFMTAAWRPKQLSRNVPKAVRLSLQSRTKGLRVPITVWSIMIVAFLFALNLQGIMAAVSPTDDTYVGGVTKAINHLSLGMIDIRAGNDEVVENPVENSVDNQENKNTEKSNYDGYVAESTEVRMQMTNAALATWSSSAKNVLVGVGLGGAGEAMFRNGSTDSPKEIVQNQYVSLLLEVGLVGILIISCLLIVILYKLFKSPKIAFAVLPLLVAYGVSLVFFAGLPNALHVYLMPVLVMILV